MDVLFALPEFTLTARDGAPFGSADLRGQVWIADFIFTRCPGTCPMQTAEKVKLHQELQGDPAAATVRLVSFTVDPEYDTASVMAAYAKAHGAEGPHWKFLTGSRGDLWNLSANGFRFDVAEDAKNEEMPILHSSRFALVDRAGRVRGIYDGLDEEGNALADGAYRFEVHATSADGDPMSVAVFKALPIDGVTFGETGIGLVSGDQEILFDAILEIRTGQSNG